MKPLTREWIAKAETDFEDAQRLLRVRNRVDFFTSGFHAQQCAEKYLKAAIVESGLPVHRDHNLTNLLTQLYPRQPLLVALQDAAEELTDLAVRVRYPGAGVTKAHAKRALDACRLIRSGLRAALGLGTAGTGKRGAARGARAPRSRSPRAKRR